MNIYKVGKRWFICKGPEIDVEASYGNGIKTIQNDALSREAGYSVYDWVPVRKWNITGKGAKKYRNEIILELEESLNLSNGTNEPPSECGSRIKI